VAIPAQAHEPGADTRPAALREVAFDQRVNEQVPLDLVFRDEAGRPVRLSEYFGTRPVILVPVYYRCRNLCPLVLDGLVRTLRGVSFDVGSQFNVVTVSFDPRDAREVAAAAKTKYLDQYGRPGAAAGWYFLTGEDGAIQRLTQAVGFHFTYDAATDQFAHASGIVILTPGGRILRYMYGIEFSPRDLRLSLVEASANKLGTIIDQALLFCYHYDPVTGRYSLLVLNVFRLAAVATVAALGTFIAVMGRRERRRVAAARGKA
jgi:protein SCO1/2